MDILSQDPIITATAGTVGIIWLFRTIYRRISKDGAEVAKDRAEINIIDTLQSQIATLSAENQRLRTTESEFSNRLGRLEGKEQEAARHMEMIEKLQSRLQEKDTRIEELISSHGLETGSMRTLLEIKNGEIKELHERLQGLEERLLRDESNAVCIECSKQLKRGQK